MMNQTEKEQLSQQILEKLKAAGADEYECTVTNSTLTEFSCASDRISMIRTSFNEGLSIKVVKDQKKGVFSTNVLDESNLDAAIETVMQSAASATPDEANGVCDEPAQQSFECGVFEPDKQSLYTNLDHFIQQTKQDYPHISFDSISADHLFTDVLYQNSNGTRLQSKRGLYSFNAMFMGVEEKSTSSFNSAGAVFTDPNVPFMQMAGTAQILDQTQRQIHTINPGKTATADIIVSPQCMDDLLELVEGNFLSDNVLINATSLFRDKINQPVAAPQVTIWCRPRSEQIVDGYFFTSDGYVAEDMPLIENGILKNFTLSRYGAKRTGLQRSKNYGGCYVMQPGQTDLEEMIQSTSYGILLNRISGGSPGVDGDLSGVMKNSFLIENGKITGALSETMFSANLAQMLQNVRQISKQTLCDGCFVLPWVKIGGITVSGK